VGIASWISSLKGSHLTGFILEVLDEISVLVTFVARIWCPVISRFSMSLDMSVPKNIPALQQENLALRKQLRRAEKNHRDALEQSKEDSQKALERAGRSHQKAQDRAQENLHDAQNNLSQTLQTYRSLVQELEDLQKQSQVIAQESLERRNYLEQLKEPHRLLTQECSQLRQKVEKLQEQRRLEKGEFLLHQEEGSEHHHKHQPEFDELNSPGRQDRKPDTQTFAASNLLQ